MVSGRSRLEIEPFVVPQGGGEESPEIIPDQEVCGKALLCLHELSCCLSDFSSRGAATCELQAINDVRAILMMQDPCLVGLPDNLTAAEFGLP